MTDSRNGKGGFSAFAKRESGAVERAKDVKTTPIVAAPAPVPDINPDTTLGVDQTVRKH
jgi:hypothetical protein